MSMFVTLTLNKADDLPARLNDLFLFRFFPRIFLKLFSSHAPAAGEELIDTHCW